METAALLVEIVRWWGFIGVLVAVAFLAIGIERVEESARGSYIFRPLLIPGILLLWPLVLWRWVVLEVRGAALQPENPGTWAKRYAPLRRAHTPVWIVLSLVIAVLLGAALALRQPWPAAYEPERIGEADGSAPGSSR